MLSKKTIMTYIREGKISIKPHYDESQLRPLGIRVHLGREILRRRDDQLVDLSQQTDIQYKKYDIAEDGLVLNPGEFVLGTTVESIQVSPDLYCILDGRSTLARLGVAVHCTAHVIDGNNFEHRSIVLEISNHSSSPVKIPYLYGIGMLGFGHSSEPLEPQDIQQQYQKQQGVVPPNLAFQADPFKVPGDAS